MHKPLPIVLLALLALGVSTCSQPPQQASHSAPASVQRPLTENDKIEKLITLITDMKNAQFIRKGTPYDCKSAAQFMRGKWQWKSAEVKTARDFIRICSAGGSGEGTPYFIRFSDGTQLPSKDFLTRKLDELESTATAAP